MPAINDKGQLIVTKKVDTSCLAQQQSGTMMILEDSKTAVVTLDMQQGMLDMGEERKSVLPHAAKVVEYARRQGIRIIHVGLGFSENYPEVPDFQTPFLNMKQNNLFIKGSPSAEFHPSIFRPCDLVIYKQRFGAFSENHLDLVLRSRGVKNLVLFGISTSGIVLSTVTRAFDMDYRISVISDACFDPDAEVHRVLTGKVFLRRAAVMTADEWITAQP